MGDDLFAEARAEIEAARRGEPVRDILAKATPSPLVRPEGGQRIALPEDAATHLVSMTFASRTNNTQPHVVTVGYDDIPRCTCRSSTPCWAVKGFCGVTGRATP